MLLPESVLDLRAAQSDQPCLEQLANQRPSFLPSVPGDAFEYSVEKEQALHILRSTGYRESERRRILRVSPKRCEDCVSAKLPVVKRGRAPPLCEQHRLPFAGPRRKGSNAWHRARAASASNIE